MIRSLKLVAAVFAAALVLVSAQGMAQVDLLQSWNDGPAKRSIVSLVKAAADTSSPGYVAPEDRIATFDNDGTLWVSHPMYAQGVFVIDQVRAMAGRHPEWRRSRTFRAILSGNMETCSRFTETDWATIGASVFAGLTTDEYAAIAGQWLETAMHPRFRRPYTQLAYQPMLELLAYLRANGFKTYIVTGGGQDFVRVFSNTVYGVPPEQVIGSSLRTEYEYKDGAPVLVRDMRPLLHNDEGGKPVGIHLFVGKKPVVAVGNSHGDQQMLEYATYPYNAGGTRLGMLVLHDDKDREYGYGPAAGLDDTHIGTFPQELMDEAVANGWIVISMKNDWNRIFGFDD